MTYESGLDPADCTHWVGCNNKILERLVIIDKDDADLLDEDGSVEFNFCPWCGKDLRDGLE